MPRLIATYRWELLIVVGLVGTYAATRTALSVSRDPTDATTGVVALLGLRAVLMGALYLRLRRLGYGLEFALLAAVPFTAGLASLGYFLAFSYLAEWSLFFAGPLVAPLTTAALLSVLYGYVRRAQGGFLGLVCGLMLAAAAAESAIAAHQLAPNLYVTAAFLLGGSLYAWRLRLGFTRPVWAAAFAAVLIHLVFTAALDRPSLFIFVHSSPGSFFITEFLTMLLVLWFARRASRVSLAHAFFIVALVFSFPFVRLFELVAFQSDAETPLRVLASAAASGASSALWFSATLAAVWMLGNFDRRGAAFRKRAAAALFGIRAAVGVAGVVILASRGDVALAQDARTAAVVIIGWGATIALVYLLRDRRPAISARDAAPPGGA